jgi:CheY-like chemotaxis protein
LPIWDAVLVCDSRKESSGAALGSESLALPFIMSGDRRIQNVRRMACNLLNQAQSMGQDMNHSLQPETALANSTASIAQVGPTPDEVAMLLCSRDGQLQPFTETILLVEDDAFVREVAGEILRSAGYRVLRARSAEEGLKTYRECGAQVDMLLTDIVLPGESGPALAQKLRLENPALKILLITGYIEKMRNWMEGKSEECLPKPFSAQSLLQRVRRVLDERGKPGGRAFKHAAGGA